MTDWVRLPLPPEPITPRPIEPLLCDSRTIFFGAGGVGKGILSCALIAASVGAMTLPSPLAVMREGMRIGILDFEDNQEEWNDRLTGMGVAFQSIPYFGSKPFNAKYRAPIAEAKRWVEGEGVDMVFVDSVIPAVGGIDVGDPRSAELFRGSMDETERPYLALAHVTKSVKGPSDYPYGSVTWANNARLIWRVDKEDISGDGLSLSLTNTKASRWRQEYRPIDISFRFGEMGRISVNSIRGAGFAVSALVDALRDIPNGATLDDIAMNLDKSKDTIEKMINRYPDIFEKKRRPAPGRPALYGLKPTGGQGDTLI